MYIVQNMGIVCYTFNVMKTFSKEEIRRILCRYQNLDGADDLCDKPGTESIMQRIGSIQYDPLNVVARNADLVLQARVKNYKESYLYELLYKDHRLVDGYDKEMCIYNTCDFGRFEFVRKEHEKQVLATLRYRNQLNALEILDEVRDFVAKHGKTGTKDISIGEGQENRWGHKKLSSAALDYLFNIGVLSVAEKKGTQKYFDLTERVIEFGTSNTTNMSLQDFYEWYVERRIQCVGLLWNKNGGAWQGHFVSNTELRTKTLQALEEKGHIEKIQIEDIKEPFYICKNFYKYMNSKTSGSYAHFIAPLDNIMWDRQMLETLFGFEYRWEVYTPAEKRKFGYYVLPVLYNGRFVARFEAEPVRQAKAFVIKNWWWEPTAHPDAEMKETIMKEMEQFAEFLEVKNSKKNKLVL